MMETDQRAKSCAEKKAIMYGRWGVEMFLASPVMKDKMIGVVNWAKYSAIDNMGMTVTAADFPACREAVEMINGTPRPLANPIRAEPTRVPAQPPTSQRHR